MPLLLENLSEKKLLTILHLCEDTRRLRLSFGGRKSYELLKSAGYKEKVKINNHKMIYCSIIALDYFCLPLDVSWVVFSFVALSPTGLIALGIASVILAAGLAIHRFVVTHSQQIRQEQQFNNTFKLFALKKQVLIELFRRLNSFADQNSIAVSDSKANFNLHTEINYEEIEVAKEQAIFTALFTTGALFGTFWFVSDFAFALGLMSLGAAMTGPVGLVISLTIAFSLGIYGGLKSYQISYNEQKYEIGARLLNHEINQGKVQYDKNLLRNNVIQTIPSKNKKLLGKKIQAKTSLIRDSLFYSDRQDKFLRPAISASSIGTQISSFASEFH